MEISDSELLRELKKAVDGDDLFHTEFTVRLP